LEKGSHPNYVRSTRQKLTHDMWYYLHYYRLFILCKFVI
jgi:hypothetical protein